MEEIKPVNSEFIITKTGDLNIRITLTTEQYDKYVEKLKDKSSIVDFIEE
jgi:hypothetical protein